MSKAQSPHRFKWMLVVAAVLLLPLLISLGFWQLDRADQKQKLVDSWTKEQTYEQLPEYSAFSKNKYIQLKLQGYLDTERYFLLDNRIRDSRIGYEVVSLLKTQNSEQVLVNLGWVEAGTGRDHLPEVALPSKELTVHGYGKRLQNTFTLGAIGEGSSWPRVIQGLEHKYLEQALGIEVAPIELRIKQPILKPLNIEWPIAVMPPQKHLAYAVQWFSMALALFVLLLWSANKLKEEMQHE